MTLILIDLFIWESFYYKITNINHSFINSLCITWSIGWLCTTVNGIFIHICYFISWTLRKSWWIITRVIWSCIRGRYIRRWDIFWGRCWGWRLFTCVWFAGLEWRWFYMSRCSRTIWTYKSQWELHLKKNNNKCYNYKTIGITNSLHLFFGSQNYFKTWFSIRYRDIVLSNELYYIYGSYFFNYRFDLHNANFGNTKYT